MKKLVLLSAVVFGMVFYSCSSDDDNATKEEVNLVGDWQLTNVDFITMTEGGIPASDGCIVELITGYEFRADSKFYFILTDGEYQLFDPYAAEFWTWEGNMEDFAIIQTNKKRPGYHFGLSPENIVVKEVEGKSVITFNGELGNGSKAKFTLVKQKIDRSKSPVLTNPDGSSYYCGFFDNK
ncbi:MAG: hypothetical protein ACOH2D_14395 [Gelidibacter sp.]|uniref:hypothetical protein n=1 Tax=Gelidibacter sp. TaxID=2018083 RepID=UPI003263D6DF